MFFQGWQGGPTAASLADRLLAHTQQAKQTLALNLVPFSQSLPGDQQSFAHKPEQNQLPLTQRMDPEVKVQTLFFLLNMRSQKV